jgi:hypothetical protein
MRVNQFVKPFILAVLVLLPFGVNAATSQPRDNDTNAMIRGGTYSQDTLISKLNSHPQDCSGRFLSNTVGDEFSSLSSSSNFGAKVNAATIRNSTDGIVTRSGNVLVNGKVVATGAQSFGRCNLGGSTLVGHLYMRPTSVSFQQSQLDAFVHMTNGRFDYAIIKSCGNLVQAKSVAVAKKPVQKVPAKVVPEVIPEVTPPPTVIVTQIQTQTQAQTQPTPAPTPSPTPELAPQPVPVEMPKTGMETGGVGALSVLLTSGGYYLRSRRQLKLAQVMTPLERNLNQPNKHL